MKKSKLSEWNLDSGAWDEKAQSAADEFRAQLISTTLPAPGLSVDAFWQQAEGQERFFWQSAHESTAVAGFGVAADLRAWGDGRFQSIERQAAELYAEAIIEDHGEPAAMPRLFGGFAFSADFTPDNTWAVFYPAQFILPHYQFAQTHTQGWLTINAVVTPDEDPDAILPELKTALQERYAQLLTVQKKPAVANASISKVTYPMPFATWQKMIEQATASMNSGPLNKVVLSRVSEIRFNGRAPIEPARHYLKATYPDCHRFWFEPRPFHAFYGATPELLARVNGRQLQTMGLAGSIRRGKTPAEDEVLAKELLQSKKDLYEHAVVVDSIRRRLAPITSELVIPDEPDVLRLGYIQHLYSPINGRLQEKSGILPIVARLHPTPALGGSPRDLAMAFIREAEPVPRGWYAAPVGWLDHQLEGTFSVAIRSAIAQDRRVWLHAGAGIVADSDPQREWDETQLKFKPMLQALGIEELS